MLAHTHRPKGAAGALPAWGPGCPPGWRGPPTSHPIPGFEELDVLGTQWGRCIWPRCIWGRLCQASRCASHGLGAARRCSPAPRPRSGLRSPLAAPVSSRVTSEPVLANRACSFAQAKSPPIFNGCPAASPHPHRLVPKNKEPKRRREFPKPPHSFFHSNCV